MSAHPQGAIGPDRVKRPETAAAGALTVASWPFLSVLGLRMSTRPEPTAIASMSARVNAAALDRRRAAPSVSREGSIDRGRAKHPSETVRLPVFPLTHTHMAVRTRHGGAHPCRLRRSICAPFEPWETLDIDTPPPASRGCLLSRTGPQACLVPGSFQCDRPAAAFRGRLGRGGRW